MHSATKNNRTIRSVKNAWTRVNGKSVFPKMQSGNKNENRCQKSQQNQNQIKSKAIRSCLRTCFFSQSNFIAKKYVTPARSAAVHFRPSMSEAKAILIKIVANLWNFVRSQDALQNRFRNLLGSFHKIRLSVRYKFLCYNLQFQLSMRVTGRLDDRTI